VTSDGYTPAGHDVEITLQFAPPTGTNLMVVKNTSTSPIEGRFSNLTHGQLIRLRYGVSVYRFVANYHGGNGNDLVLQWADTRAFGNGPNEYGELGDHYLSYEADLVPVNTSGILKNKTLVAVASGVRHGLALCSDGTLASWGSNDNNGLLGNNNGPDSFVPILVDRTGFLSGKAVTQIAAGNIHSLALCSDGTMAAWGYNTSISPQGYPTSSPVPVGVDTTGVLSGKHVIAIAAGMLHNLALCSDGTLVSWGSNTAGQLGTADLAISYSSVPIEVDRTGPLSGKTVVAIAAGGRHSLALCSDGTVSAWGDNTHGELGNGSNTGSRVPVAVSMTSALAAKTVVKIAAGGHFDSNHSMALCSDGTLATWGGNFRGQLGTGDTSNRNLPVDLSNASALAGKTVVAISAGSEQSYAQCSDGSAAAWGSGAAGLAGTHALANSKIPVAISTSDAGDSLSISQICGSSSSPRVFLLLSLPMTNTGLSSLAVINGVHAQASPTGIAAYSVAVPNGTASVSILGSPADADAVISVNGTPVPNGSPSQAIALSGQLNPVQVSVTAADGTTTKIHELTVVRPDSITATFNSPHDVPASLSAYDASGLTISLTLNCPLEVGAELKIIDNTGIDFIRGHFGNLQQGQVVSLSNGTATYRLAADYFGGDGNDLVLRWTNRMPYLWGYNVPSPLGSIEQYGYSPITFSNLGALGNRIVEKMDSGASHTLLSCTDGTLVGWGQDLSGSLGLAHGDLTSPTVLDLGSALAGKRVIDVQVGDWHSLALCSDGSVYTWGGNYFGQLGNNRTSSGGNPVQVNAFGDLQGRRVVAVSTFSATSIALCSDGNIVAWGRYHAAVPMIVARRGALKERVVKTIRRGGCHSLAVCTDGTLVSWGYNSSGPDSLLISPLEPYGQLGHGHDYASSYPVLVDANGALAGKSVVSIAAGFHHSTVICTDGTVATWGYNLYGQLGNDSRTSSNFPVVISGSGTFTAKNPIQIACGEHHGMALCDDGTISSWGFNIFGQLGDGTNIEKQIPVAVGTSALPPGVRFTSLVPGPEGWHSAALASTRFGDSRLAGIQMFPGSLASTFSSTKTEYLASVPFAVEETTLTVVTSDADSSIRINGVAIPQGSNDHKIDMIPGLNSISIEVTSPDASSTRTYTVTVWRPTPLDATFTSAGHVPAIYPAFDATGLSPQVTLAFAPETGTDLMLIQNTGPGFVSGTFTNLTHGQLITLAHDDIPYRYVVDYYGGDGNDIVLHWASNRSYAWGSPSGGTLGINTSVVTKIPHQVTDTGILSGKTIVSLAMGENHSLAMCSDGTLVTWGLNYSTPAGNTWTPVEVPRAGALANKTVIGIASGRTQRLALCSDGTIATWQEFLSTAPSEVSRTGVLAGKVITAIAAGASHYLALCSDGQVVTWGANSYGQLGTGNFTTSNEPVNTSHSSALSGKTVTELSAGSNHSLALCSDGTMAAWGDNASGQLGDNSTTRKSSPVAVDHTGALAGKTVISISAGAFHNLALCSDGTVVSWGSGGNGRLGNNTSVNSQVPVLVDNTGALAGRTVVGVAACLNFSAALCSDGTVVTWGNGATGQLGNNTTTSSAVPVLVSTSKFGDGEKFSRLSSGSQADHFMAVAALSVSNNRMAALSTSSGTLTPAFNPTIQTYHVTPSTGSAFISVRPTLENPFAAARVNGALVNHGSSSAAIPLTSATTLITVEITAQNGSSNQYTVAVSIPPYDAWKNTMFPNAADRANSLISGVMATPAGDGIPNLTKYALALDPFTPSAGSMPTIGEQGGSLTFTYRMSKSATDITFTVQASDTLTTPDWTSVATTPVLEDKGNYWLVKVTDPEAYANQARRFMRLKLAKP
jgi:alpha-tubulin suppressor-like RCC1 family protein